MTEDFPLPPEGMLSEEVRLVDHRLVLGLMHRDGEGIRIVSWDGANFRHMTKVAAIGLAEHMEGQPPGVAADLKLVSEALRDLVCKVGEIEARAANAPVRRAVGQMLDRWRAKGLADVEVEGHA